MSSGYPKASCLLPLALCESGAPDWIRILPAGAITPNDGRGPWLLEDAAAVVEATKRRLGNLEMLVDYNHQSEHAARNGRPAPAAGWVSALEARPEGVFARVNWTEKGAAAIAAREFRYISPVFSHDQAGRITRIISCALTNTPALDMGALCEGQAEIPKKEKLMDTKILAQALELPESATEAEIVAACHALRGTAREAGKEPDPAKYVPIAAHDAVARELAELKKSVRQAEAKALVAEARSSGRLAPAMEGWATAYAESDARGFRAWLEAAPDLRLDKPLAPSGKPPAGGKPELSPEQKAVCQAMGLDEKQYLETVREERNG